MNQNKNAHFMKSFLCNKWLYCFLKYDIVCLYIYTFFLGGGGHFLLISGGAYRSKHYPIKTLRACLEILGSFTFVLALSEIAI